MLVWLLMLVSIIVSWFVIPDALGKKKKKLIFLGLSFIIMVFVIGSRSEFSGISPDIQNYIRWYRRAIRMTLPELMAYDVLETGYLVINEIVAWFVPWEYFFFYFQAAFCTGIFFWYIYRNVDNVFLGVLAYICLGPWQFFLTGFRQSIAISICIVALEFLKKRKDSTDFIALCLVALASTVHTSAWLFLIAFIISRFRVDRFTVIFSVVLTAFMFFFVDDLVALGNEALNTGYVAGTFIGNALGGIIPIAINLAVLLLCYIIWKQDKGFVDVYTLEINLLILGTSLYTLRYSTVSIERISFYFTPVICVLLPNVITKQKKTSERIVMSAFCVALCVALFIYRANTQLGDYYFNWQF